MEDNPLLMLINIFLVVVVVSSILSIPLEIFRRLRRKYQGKVVTPIDLILKKLLRYSIIAAIIIMPSSAVIVYLKFSAVGMPQDDIFFRTFLYSILGNVFTSIFLGYFFLSMGRKSWSHSAKDKDIKKITEKQNPKQGNTSVQNCTKHAVLKSIVCIIVGIEKNIIFKTL